MCLNSGGEVNLELFPEVGHSYAMGKPVEERRVILQLFLLMILVGQFGSMGTIRSCGSTDSQRNPAAKSGDGEFSGCWGSSVGRLEKKGSCDEARKLGDICRRCLASLSGDHREREGSACRSYTLEHVGRTSSHSKRSRYGKCEASKTTDPDS